MTTPHHGGGLRPRLVRTSKEVGRHVLHRLGVKRKIGYLEPSRSAERFARIYDERAWAHGRDDVPGSGAGSSLEATAALREQLPALLDRLGSSTLLDLGCGDFTWMRHVPLRQNYVGVDIVGSVIDDNRERYAVPGRDFVAADATVDRLPAADTVLCREVLFHLGFDDIRKLLTNVLSTERRWFITTTDAITLFNSDIETGDFRFLNLRRPPFRFEEPVAVLRDPGVAESRVLGVWPARSVAEAMGISITP